MVDWQGIFDLLPDFQTADLLIAAIGSLAGAWGVRTQRAERLGEIASRDALQVQDRQKRLDRLGAAHVGRQDRRREPDARGITGGSLAIAHTRRGASSNGCSAFNTLANIAREKSSTIVLPVPVVIIQRLAGATEKPS